MADYNRFWSRYKKNNSATPKKWADDKVRRNKKQISLLQTEIIIKQENLKELAVDERMLRSFYAT